MTTSEATLSEEVTPLINAIWLFVIVQFIVFAVTVPIAVLNFVVIFQTSVSHFTVIYASKFRFWRGKKVRNLTLLRINLFQVVHRNLKLILLVQSFDIAVWALALMEVIVEKYLRNDVFFDGSKFNQFLVIFWGNILVILGHVLLVERVLSTVLIRNYETNKRWHFSICWLIFSVKAIKFL